MRNALYRAEQTFCREVLPMNSRESMLKKLSAAQFTLWEMHLYLDTHPWDLQMVEAHNKCMMKYRALRSEFEDKFGSLSAANAQGFEWLKGPWPWDEQECDC